MLSIQSKRIEKTAKSTDEAINLALSELGATRDMVEIEILKRGQGPVRDFRRQGREGCRYAQADPGLRRKGVFRRVVFQHGYEG